MKRDEIIKQTGFLPKTISIYLRKLYIKNNITEQKKCECGCNGLLLDFRKRFIRGHSNKCQDIKEKKKKTSLERYGTNNPSSSIQIKNKKKLIFQERYGCNSSFEIPSVKTRYKETMKLRYGVENPFLDNNIQNICHEKWKKNKSKIIEKIKIKNLQNKQINVFNRINKSNIKLLNENDYCGVQLYNTSKIYSFQCLVCNKIFSDHLNNGRLPRCPVCFPKSTSKPEQEIKDWLKSKSINFEHRYKKLIYPLELDFFLIDQHIGIEYDSLYYHNETVIDKEYHLNKTNLCEQKGIKLIHIFSDEYYNNPQIVYSRLENLIGKSNRIYARQCNIREISVLEKTNFLNTNHIQGADQSNIRIGLYKDNTLVALMTFSKLRKALGNSHKEGYWELSRFCNILNTTVIGGAAKLLKYFEQHYNPTEVISYADRRWSQGNMYYKLGFTLDHISKPNYWYTQDFRTRKHRFGFQKHLLSKRLEIFDPLKTEHENMMNNNWFRVYDCGNLVFKKVYEN